MTALLDNLQWQISARARIQQIILEQYKFLDSHTISRDQREDEWYAMVRMVHISYSLWRAAFLTNVENKPEMTYDKSKEFLKRILTHNAIGFSEDFANRDYTVGYYIANARYRIERMLKYDRTLNKVESVRDIIQISLDDNYYKRRQEDIWDICYRALYACFEHFKRNFRCDAT